MRPNPQFLCRETYLNARGIYSLRPKNVYKTSESIRDKKCTKNARSIWEVGTG